MQRRAEIMPEFAAPRIAGFQERGCVGSAREFRVICLLAWRPDGRTNGGRGYDEALFFERGNKPARGGFYLVLGGLFAGIAEVEPCFCGKPFGVYA